MARSPRSRFLPLLKGVGLLIPFLLPGVLHAATNTWDGGGTDGKISTAANWDNDTAPAATGANVIFAGSTNLNVTNDSITALATANTAVTFASGAGSFNLGGNAITMGSGGGGGQTIIQQSSTNPQTISANISLSGGNGDRSIVFAAGAGSLTLAGNINFGTANGDWLFPTTTAGTIILSGNNSGDGKATAAVTSGTNVMRAMMRNNVAGTVLVLGSDTALGNTATSSTNLRGVLANQNMVLNTIGERNLSGYTLAINTGNVTYNGSNNITIGNIINHAGNRDFWVTNTGVVTVASNIYLSGDQTGRQLYINATNGGNVVVNGKINDTFHSGGLTSGSSTLRKGGTGKLWLNGSNSASAAITVDAGALLVNGEIAPITNSARIMVSNVATLGGNGTIRPFDTTGSLTGLSVSGTLSPGDPSVNGGLGTLTLDGTNSMRNLLALESGAKVQVDLMTDTNSSRLSDKVAIVSANGSSAEVFFNGNVINFSDPTGILPAGSYTLFEADAASAFSGTPTAGAGLEIYSSKSISVSGNSVVLTLGAATAPASAPPVPTGLAATAPEPYKVVLNWNHSYRATSYVVRRGTASGSYTDLATVTAPAITYTDTTATPGTIYYYVVAAVNAAGTSGNSAEVSGASYEPRGIGINLKPSSSAGMTTNDLAGAIHLANWNNMTGPTGYGNAQTLANPLDSSGAVVGGMTVTVTGGSSSSTFAYNAAAGNDSTLFDTVFDQFDGTAGTISVTGVPYATYDVYLYMRSDGAARGGAFTIGGTTYYVRGGLSNPATNGTGYVVSSATTNGGTNTAQGNYVRFSGLTNTNFTCSFVAFNAGDNVQRLKFPGFQIVSGAPVATVPPGVPSGLTITPTGLTTVTLAWQSAAGAAEYKIYRSTTAGSFDYGSPLATISATATSYSDTSAVEGTTYYYVIRASNSVGVSADSAQVTTPVPDLSSVAVSSPVLWPGQSTTFTWSVPNAAGISINDGSGAQSYPANGSLAVALDATKTYAFSATNAQGTATKDVAVSVVPKPDTRDALWQWSVPITGYVSAETQDNPRAFLYIPPGCKRVRGVIIGQHNMLEEPIMENKAVRQGLADAGMAAIWVTPAFDGNFNFTANPNTPVIFQQMMDDLAAESGYSELSKAPVVWIGHSAMAEAPYFFAAWDTQNSVATGALKRCAAAISVKGWYPGKHDSTTPTYANSDLAGVPIMYIEGEYADANGRAGGALSFRNATAGSIVSYFADVGGGHFDWNDNLCEYIGMYLRKLGEYRLPETLAGDGTGTLKTINTASQGWQADRWRKGTNPTATPAAVGSYAGNASEAFWYFDQEHAEQTHNRQLPVRTQYQLLGYTQNGVLVPQQETHIQVQPAFVADPAGDGLTFKLGTTFLTDVPAVSSRLASWSGLPVGSPIGHSTNGPILISRICGPVEQLSPDTFRVSFDRVGTENIYGQNRSRDICFQAVHPGDTNYVRAVQQGMIRVPLPRTSGTTQTISVPPIAEQSINATSIPLTATTTGTNTYPAAKVDFYVREGPAKVVDGNKLELTTIPPRTKFPVKVTVVGTQFGRNIAPLLQTATPVTNTFNITATDVEQWRLQHFGSHANEGGGADSADPDGDERDNALERQFGSDPNSANTSASDRYQTWARVTNAPTGGAIGKYAFGGATGPDAQSESHAVSKDASNNLVLTAIVRTNNGGLSIVGQTVSDLAGTWTDLADNPRGVHSINAANVPSGCERRDFKTPVSGSKKFLRLKADFQQ